MDTMSSTYSCPTWQHSRYSGNMSTLHYITLQLHKHYIAHTRTHTHLKLWNILLDADLTWSQVCVYPNNLDMWWYSELLHSVFTSLMTILQSKAYMYTGAAARKQHNQASATSTTSMGLVIEWTSWVACTTTQFQVAANLAWIAANLPT